MATLLRNVIFGNACLNKADAALPWVFPHGGSADDNDTFPTVAGKLPGTQKDCTDVKTAGYSIAMVHAPRVKVSLNSFHIKERRGSSASKKEY